jgi:hypothetical protein
VSKTSELVHNWWVVAQLKAPSFAQRTVIPRLHEAKEVVRLLAKPYLPVCRMQGQAPGGPLTVTFVGLEFGLVYTKPYLTRILFVKKPTERQVGRIPFWRYHELAALSSDDMIIVAAAKHLIGRLPRQNAIVLPELVDHVLDAQGSWEDIMRRFHKGVHRQELRLARKYDYRCEISYDDRAFATFYNDMYLPTMKSRHGALAFPMPVDEAHLYFQYGFLLFVTRNGQRVCGSICHVEQDTLQCVILGVLNADEQAMKEGALGALSILCIRWANQQGYKAVNLLGSLPYPKSGIFQSKRKWGGTITIPSHSHRQIWIKINRNTPAVSQFLRENPFVMVDNRGKLHGLIIVDDVDSITPEVEEQLNEQYFTPGMGGLLICSTADSLRTPSNQVQKLCTEQKP